MLVFVGTKMLIIDWINIHVGLSINGLQELHDLHRKTNNGKPTFNFVMGAAKRLVDADVPFAALCAIKRFFFRL